MNDELCPIAALLGYLACRPSFPWFLFLFSDGTQLSRIHQYAELKVVLRATRIDTAGYSGHSFHIGEATIAVQVSFSGSLIQTLGRWRSAAFLDYIRRDVGMLKNIASSCQIGHV